jgi:ABC-type uncharacterized transport system permease subunit
MLLLAQIAQLIFWFALWAVIPAALLYPAALWMLLHTHYSFDLVTDDYIMGVCLLFLPTGFLVDFLYRKFILKKQTSN